MKNVKIKELFELTKNLDILYVEDDMSFNDETSDILEDFFNKVDSVYNGKEALQFYQNYFNKHNKYYDIVISDINMPQMDGIELSKKIYDINEKQAIIIVSAYNETEYLVELINIGVERFLQKPFKHEQLLEVLFNVLNKKRVLNTKISFGNNLIWDSSNETLSQYDNIIKLTKKELLLLKLFVKNGSKISTTEEIFNIVWDDDSSVATTDSLKMHISRLRKKLDGVDIETLYNIGYRINF